MERLLVIDDDTELCELVVEYLTAEGFAVEVVHDGESGVRRATSEPYALIILDVMLPRLDGFETLKRIRAVSHVPTLMLTARGDDVDRIVGLEIGADDYLSKPFNPRELLARIRAILRRTKPELLAEKLVVGDVELDFGSRSLRKQGQTVAVTSVEFDLLAVLLQHAGQIVSRDDLSLRALGRSFHPLDRSVDMHISNLRKKLGPHADGSERIKSVRGVGYLYAVCPPAETPASSA
ncbi:response regulator transcription factor [Chloracidobacterium aggregatum]|jgi:two-component system response regulator CpxR|uniref:response regulator transcription factor n=1 Tax=Chloracidobacterium aggregatum TaxID=2851959 RepID=UPI001B8BC5F9|nr:response regulator transcription factor [Chloracidobacterium aggregatum]QUV85948.1 response regulator transcription factor [Chloracidobacterium sp. 2]QUV89627.1 response regulator transcription factor [Chloracidobacterium sp. S]QUV92377.1 response regulator transcription factor [Chloracidobacterium sp. A]